jgi:hypothetical protein
MPILAIASRNGLMPPIARQKLACERRGSRRDRARLPIAFLHLRKSADKRKASRGNRHHVAMTTSEPDFQQT